MSGLLTRNVGWKLLSLLIAIIIWLAVGNEPEMATVLSAPVAYKNLPNTLEISSRMIENVNLETRGPAGRLRDLSEARTAVILDFTGVTSPGERTFTIESANTKLPRGIQLLRAIPAQLRIQFERRVMRDVPVRLRQSGEPPNGIQIAQIDLIPKKLGIVGPESHVDQVAFVSTDPVDLKSVRHDTTLRVSAYAAESQVRFQAYPVVTVKITVRK